MGRKEDKQHCWSQVRVTEGADQQTGQPLPVSYFICQGLLYFCTEFQGEPTDLLVVPHSKGDVVIHLAHTHALCSHLAW